MSTDILTSRIPDVYPDRVSDSHTPQINVSTPIVPLGGTNPKPKPKPLPIADRLHSGKVDNLCDIEAEQNLLFCLLSYPDQAGEVLGAIDLKPEDFYHTQYQWVYRAIVAIVGDGEQPTIINLERWLQHGGNLDRAGGKKAIVAMISFQMMPSESPLQSAQSIKNKALIRALQSTLSQPEGKTAGQIKAEVGALVERIGEPDSLRSRLRALAFETDLIKAGKLRRDLNAQKFSDKWIDAAIQQIRHSTATETGKRSYSAKEFMAATRKPQEFVANGLLAKSSLIVMFGDGKLGKSLFVTDLIYAAIKGDRLGSLTWFSAPKKVLLVSLDEGNDETRDKLFKRDFDGLADEQVDRLRIISHDSGISGDNLTPLAEELEDFRPDLVVIDSLRALIDPCPYGENDAEVGEPVKKLLLLVQQYQCAGLLIHHCNKDNVATGSGKASGHTSIITNASGWFEYSALNPKDATNPNRLLKVGGSRTSIQPFTYEIQVNPDSAWIDKGCCDYLGELGNPEDESAGDTVQRLVALLQKQPTVRRTGEEIQYLMGGNADTIYRGLSKAAAKALISRAKADRPGYVPGKGKKHTWVYWWEPVVSADDDVTECNEKQDSLSHSPPLPFRKEEKKSSETSTGEEFRANGSQTDRDRNPTGLRHPSKRIESDESDRSVCDPFAIPDVETVVSTSTSSKRIAPVECAGGGESGSDPAAIGDMVRCVGVDSDFCELMQIEDPNLTGHCSAKLIHLHHFKAGDRVTYHGKLEKYNHGQVFSLRSKNSEGSWNWIMPDGSISTWIRSDELQLVEVAT
jgi:AAA domain/DnaB-like helicase N terminal domain